MTHTIPHYIKSNAKNYPKDIALREKKFGVWKTKDWQQCLEEIENITLGLHAKGITGKKTIAILGNNTPRWTLAEIAVQSLGSIPLGIYSDALESEIIFNRIINLTISESTLSPTPQACDFKRLVCNLTKSFSPILKF